MTIFEAMKLWKKTNKAKEAIMQTEGWWRSISIWGSIIGAVAFVLQILGITSISAEEQQALAQQIANIATSVGIVIGLIMAIIGRVRATKRISNQIIPGVKPEGGEK